MPRIGEKFTFELSWQEQLGLRTVTDPNRQELADRVVDRVPQLRRGQVWCTVCGHTEQVDASESLATGWPKHCGYTMTIDSPEERAAFTHRREAGV